mgnify:CR=1 FL=1
MVTRRVILKNIKKKFKDHKLPLVDEVIELDAKKREVNTRANDLRANRNKVSKEIGGLMAKGLREEAEAKKQLVSQQAAELAELEPQVEKLTEQIQYSLLPRDATEDRDALVEIRAGTGGEEASLFGGDLLRMYQRYAERHRYAIEFVEDNRTEMGGVKEVVLTVSGRGAYSRLKFESGVHRVQRVPVTESSGRIHTSTATVAVLPEMEEVDVQLNPADIAAGVYPNVQACLVDQVVFLLFAGGEGAAHHGVLADHRVFTQDSMTDDSAGLDHDAGHNNGILNHSILTDVAAGRDDGVSDLAVDGAAFCHECVDDLGIAIDVGRGMGIVTGIDLTALVTPDIKVRRLAQQLHIGFPQAVNGTYILPIAIEVISVHITLVTKQVSLPKNALSTAAGLQ